MVNKIKNGRLYETWLQRAKKARAKPSNTQNVSPSTHLPPVHEKDIWHSTLQRQQKLYYFQKSLDMTRNAPSNHLHHHRLYWANLN